VTGTPYHHGNLRDALVEAAVDVVREGGPEALALRELARRVGVSHAAAYRHFADREALVDVVAQRALQTFVERIRERLATIDESDPVTRARRRLVEIGVAYVGFALTESGLFRLLFTAYPDAPDGNAPDGKGELAGEDPYAMLNEALDDLVEVGYLDERDRVGADVTCWAAVHGFSVLNVEGPLRGLQEVDRDVALSTMLLGIDRAFGAGREWPRLAPVMLNNA